MSGESLKDSIISESNTMNNYPKIVDKLIKQGFVPDPNFRPQRCRAIILNPEGSKVLGIKRNRPGSEEYVVFPGGGVEDFDLTALDTVHRELQEELEIEPQQIDLTGSVLGWNNEYFYIGIANEEFQDLVISGPESTRDVNVSGTYIPEWFSVDSLIEINFLPEEIKSQIINSAN